MTPADVSSTLLAAYNTPSFDTTYRKLKPQLSLAVFEALKAAVDRERLRQPQQALHIATLMETLATDLNQPAFKAMAWWAKGNCLYHLCRYQEALTCFQQAQKHYQAPTHQLEILRLQINQVAVLNEIGDHETALSLAETARQQCYEVGETAQRYLALLEMNVGWAFYKMGQLSHALTAYDRGRLSLQAVDDVVEMARVDINRAIILEEMNQFDRAQSLLQQAQTVLKTHHCDQEVARVALNVGLLAHRRGQYQAALSHLEAAHGGFTAIENWVEVAVVNLRRAFVYRDLNLLREMVTLAGEAERIFNEHQMHWQQALALISQGIGYRRLGLFDVADRLLKQARQILQKQNAHGELLKLTVEQASLALAQGDSRRAHQQIEALFPQLDETRYPTLTAQAHLILAQCHLDDPTAANSTNPAELRQAARRHTETALNIARRYHLPEILITAHGWLGQVMAREGQSAAAWEQYQQAMATVETMRTRLLLDEFQLGFMAEKRFVYDEALRFSHRLGNPAQILQMLNLVYAAPLSRLAEQAAPPLNSAQATAQAKLKAELQTSREAWRWLRSKLNTPDDLLSEMWSASTQARGVDLHQQLAQLESRIADLSHRLELSTPPVGPHAPSARSVTLQTEASDFLKQVQAQLQPDAVLLHYYLVDDNLHALLITPTGIQQQVDLVTPATLNRLLKAWQFHLEHGHSLSTADQAKPYLRKFYDYLLAPLRSNLPETGHLWLVVPPQWHHLPLAGLFDGQHYAIEQWTMSYLSAVEMLLLPPATPQVAPGERLYAGVMGYSDDHHLPHATAEAESVARTLRPHYHTDLRLEAAATRGAFETLSQQCHILHLATHAVFRPDNPLFSWMRLADADLTVADIQPLRLPARPLMVLSACETGRGEARGGGLLGMARGLLAAGASGLVVSLWQLPDQSTATLIQHFYANVFQAGAGSFTAQSVTQALQAAQQEAIARNSSPRDWAGLAFVYG